MTKLLIALDCDIETSRKIMIRAYSQKLTKHKNFGGYKFGLSTILKSYNNFQSNCPIFYCQLGKIPFMLDFKLYNTESEIHRNVLLSNKLGAEWLTVHSKSINDALKISTTTKIIAVDRLTSSGPEAGFTNPSFKSASGFVCHPVTLKFLRAIYPNQTIFCPGIRENQENTDEHIAPASLETAIKNGADYVIIGRPIYNNTNPTGKIASILYTLQCLS